MANPGTSPSPYGRLSLGYSACGKSNCDDILFSPSWKVGDISEIGVGTTWPVVVLAQPTAIANPHLPPLTPVKKICKLTITFFTFLGIAQLVFGYNFQISVRFTLAVSTLHLETFVFPEVAAIALDEEWKGYVVQISYGNSKQGFPMKQNRPRVFLLLGEGHSCYRTRTRERKCKSWLWGVCGVILRGMREDIPRLTDTTLLLK